jgi:hypothetical protein
MSNAGYLVLQKTNLVINAPVGSFAYGKKPLLLQQIYLFLKINRRWTPNLLKKLMKWGLTTDVTALMTQLQKQPFFIYDLLIREASNLKKSDLYELKTFLMCVKCATLLPNTSFDISLTTEIQNLTINFNPLAKVIPFTSSSTRQLIDAHPHNKSCELILKMTQTKPSLLFMFHNLSNLLNINDPLFKSSTALIQTIHITNYEHLLLFFKVLFETQEINKTLFDSVYLKKLVDLDINVAYTSIVNHFIEDQGAANVIINTNKKNFDKLIKNLLNPKRKNFINRNISINHLVRILLFNLLKAILMTFKTVDIVTDSLIGVKKDRLRFEITEQTGLLSMPSLSIPLEKHDIEKRLCFSTNVKRQEFNFMFQSMKQFVLYSFPELDYDLMKQGVIIGDNVHKICTLNNVKNNNNFNELAVVLSEILDSTVQALFIKFDARKKTTDPITLTILPEVEIRINLYGCRFNHSFTDTLNLRNEVYLYGKKHVVQPDTVEHQILNTGRFVFSVSFSFFKGLINYDPVKDKYLDENLLPFENIARLKKLISQYFDPEETKKRVALKTTESVIYTDYEQNDAYASIIYILNAYEVRIFVNTESSLIKKTSLFNEEIHTIRNQKVVNHLVQKNVFSYFNQISNHHLNPFYYAKLLSPAYVNVYDTMIIEQERSDLTITSEIMISKNAPFEYLSIDQYNEKNIVSFLKHLHNVSTVLKKSDQVSQLKNIEQTFFEASIPIKNLPADFNLNRNSITVNTLQKPVILKKTETKKANLKQSLITIKVLTIKKIVPTTKTFKPKKKLLKTTKLFIKKILFFNIIKANFFRDSKKKFKKKLNKKK